MGIFVKDSNINTGTVGSQGSSAQGVTVHNTTIDVSNIERGNSDINTESQVTTVDLGDLINEGGSTAADVANTTITNGSVNVGETTQTSSQTSNQNMQNSNTNTENINQQGGTASQKTINNEQAQNEQSNQNAGTASGQSTSGGNQQSQGTNSQNGGIASSKSASSGGQGGGSSNQTSGVASKPAGASSGGKSGSSSGGEGASAKSGSMSAKGKQGAQGQKAGEVKGKSGSINSTTSNKIIDSNGKVSRNEVEISKQKVTSKESTIKSDVTRANENTGAKSGKGLKWFVKELVKDIETEISTDVVLATTVLSAPLRMIEKLDDAYKGYIVASIYDLIGLDDAANDLRRDAAVNRVEELNKAFYENTSLGKRINEMSTIKYDGELAKKIESFTETAITIAAAAGISALPGGVFILAAVGTLEGIGAASESAYQKALAEGKEDLSLSVLGNLGVLGSGALSAVSWIFNAKLGQGLLNIVGDIGKEGLGTIAGQLGKELFSKESLKEIIKPINLLMNGGQSLLQSGGKAGTIFSKYMNGEKVTLSEWGDFAMTFGLYFVLNSLEDRAGDIVSGYKADKAIAAKEFDVKEQAYLDDLFMELSTGINNGTYGVDQNAFKNLIIYEKKNDDWLKGQESFGEYMQKYYPKINPTDIYNQLLNGNKFTQKIKNIYIEYLTKNTDSYEEAFEMFNKSFTPVKSDYYDRIVNKLMKKGLSEEDAISYLSRINGDGACSYAAQANGIARFFADKEELFKEKFGFDLFIEVDGKKVINQHELLEDLYTYTNTKGHTDKAKLFEEVDGKLRILSRNARDQVPLSNGGTIETDIVRDYLKSKSSDFDFYSETDVYVPHRSGIMKDSRNLKPIDIYNRIKQHLDDGYNVQLGIQKTDTNQFTFYNTDGSINITTNIWGEGAAHAVFVTDITENEVIISSWGQRLKLSLSEFTNNRFNISICKLTI